MRMSLLPLAFFFPVAANAGYIDMEMLDPGTVQLGGDFAKVEVDATSDTSVGEGDVRQTGYALGLELIGGVSSNVNVAVSISPIGKNTVEYSWNDFTSTAEYEGADDLRTELRYRLSGGDSYPVFSVGARLPTGDDKDPVSEIKDSSGVLSPGESGGRGSGRTDYMVGAGYFFGSGSAKLFMGVDYVINGTADGIHYGDDLNLFGEASLPLGSAVSLVGGLQYQLSNDTADGSGGHFESAPTITTEFGAMYSFSENTEIIATVATLSGAKAEHFDEAGVKDATSEVDRAVGFALTVQSRF